MKGFLLASPYSGSGKTLMTCVILHGLAARGTQIAPCKAGPDYIDPALHQMACGILSYNLDVWGMRPQLLHDLTNTLSMGGKTLVVEAMMGLFDGAIDGTASPADLAKLLNLPIILIVDCQKMSHSVAALVFGFQNFMPDLAIHGLILNKIGSDRHEYMLRQALQLLKIPILGTVRRHDSLVMPSRHLGLVLPQESQQHADFIKRAYATIAPQINWAQLEQIAARAFFEKVDTGFSQKNATKQKIRALDCVNQNKNRSRNISLTNFSASPSFLSKQISYPMPLGQTIAIAQDEAFCFCYPHILASWQQAGAKLCFFSPLNDEAPPECADAIYLPGGYPELYGAYLAAAKRFKLAMHQAAQANVRIYGECGGFMVLGDMLEDKEGEQHEMLGLLPLITSIKTPRLTLGYRKLLALGDFFSRQNFRGHEFHYSSLIRQCDQGRDVRPLFQMRDALNKDLGCAGLVRSNIAGSFIHIIDHE